MAETIWHSVYVNELSCPVTTQGHIEVKTDDVTIGKSKNHFRRNLINSLNFICLFTILFHDSSSKKLKIPTLMMPTMIVSAVTKVNSNKQKQQTIGQTTGDSDNQNNVSESYSRNHLHQTQLKPNPNFIQISFRKMLLNKKSRPDSFQNEFVCVYKWVWNHPWANFSILSSQNIKFNVKIKIFLNFSCLTHLSLDQITKV